MLSLPKLLLLIVVVAGVWVLWRFIQRRGVSGVFRSDAPGTGQAPKALEMEKCRICGDFVAADARACTNARCPYPTA